MKKIILLSSIMLMTSLSSVSAAEVPKNSDMNSNFNQKSCQNIFTLINVDLSAFSPRVSATDVQVKNNNLSDVPKPQKPGEIPVSNVQKAPELPINSGQIKKDDETSFFRLDLLKMFRIRVF